MTTMCNIHENCKTFVVNLNQIFIATMLAPFMRVTLVVPHVYARVPSKVTVCFSVRAGETEKLVTRHQ